MTYRLPKCYILDAHQHPPLPPEVRQAIMDLGRYCQYGNDTHFWLNEDIIDYPDPQEDYSQEEIGPTMIINKFLLDNGYKHSEVLIKYWW
jgi:hypothetical protein